MAKMVRFGLRIGLGEGVLVISRRSDEIIVGAARIRVEMTQNMPDKIFVKNITRPEFLGPKFYPKKRVNRDKSKFATKQRKCYKMPNLRQQHTHASK